MLLKGRKSGARPTKKKGGLHQAVWRGKKRLKKGSNPHKATRRRDSISYDQERGLSC